MLQARYAQSVPGIPSGLPHKSHSSTDDRSFPNGGHSDLLREAVDVARPSITSQNFQTKQLGGNSFRQNRSNHCLWVFDMDTTHPFDLFRREETKLDFLNRAQWRLRVWEVNVRHDGGCRVIQIVSLG